MDFKMCWSTKSTECQPKASTEHSFHILILLLPDFQLKDANMENMYECIWISKCAGQPSQPICQEIIIKFKYVIYNIYNSAVMCNIFFLSFLKSELPFTSLKTDFA